MRLLRTSMIVRGLDAGCATRPLGNALAILGLGCAAIAGFRGGYSIRIRLGDSGISRMRVGDSGAVGSLGCGHSIRALHGGAVARLCSGYPVRILLGDSSSARIRVDGNSRLTIAANGLTTPVLDAISRK